MRIILGKIIVVILLLLSVIFIASCGFENDFVISGNEVCYVGGSIKLEAITDSEEDVIWEVSDTSVATIDNGTLVGLKPGKVTVTNHPM